jgi:hypothetical protein
MGMSFAGRGNENDRYRMVSEHGNGESERQNTEWAERSNLLGVMCIFLILARRRLYGGMGMGFAGRGNENDRYRMVAEHGNGESERQNTEWAEQEMNAEWPTTIAVLISSRDIEREMCPWAISKYFGGLVSNTSA